ncbi:divalent metal cation transporter MntH [Sphaerisporangium krabiense]|uniref:Manganese transport protein n=1 Tax=Sphaerisporangium krabiense TaxID=763782 RepID=A0A7W9DUE5_9ACTN|nr:Nramp family divalent metal transporter [Sphaerisporangium krabiense]MBB5631628.1 manganese transport protein [Sphaerisporangium krabiense]GII61042.1 divalent metal cation transporter MntH [Sphaerisporangium krabiense]
MLVPSRTTDPRRPGKARAASPPGVARARQVIGPAFVAAIAYVDPGNVATNLTAGATSGYLLVWVVVAASLVAMLVQYQAAKLGMATGRSLPRLCRERFPVWGNRLLWLQAEVVVLATDLAEFVGAAIGMRLLFGMPVALSAVVTAAASLLLLELRRRGRTRPFELASAAALLLVGAGIGYDVLVTGHQSAAGLAAGLLPVLDGHASLVLAMGIVGATVMPHAVYLHSALVQGHDAASDAAWRQPALIRRAVRLDCVLALGVATVVNTSMVALGAGLGAATGGRWAGDLLEAHAELASRVGGAAALAFAVALLSSGVSSSGVGTLAGDVVMQGFLGRRVPVHARRLVTMAPAVAALLLGASLTGLLIASQVVISLGVPVALFLLVLFCRDRSVMGPLVNAPLTTRVAGAAGGVVALLGCVLALTTVVGH